MPTASNCCCTVHARTIRYVDGYLFGIQSRLLLHLCQLLLASAAALHLPPYCFLLQSTLHYSTPSSLLPPCLPLQVDDRLTNHHTQRKIPCSPPPPRRPPTTIAAKWAAATITIWRQPAASPCHLALPKRESEAFHPSPRPRLSVIPCQRVQQIYQPLPKRSGAIWEISDRKPTPHALASHSSFMLVCPSAPRPHHHPPPLLIGTSVYPTPWPPIGNTCPVSSHLV